MKILVFSDSHGNNFMMQSIVNMHKPDKVLHLGDHNSDAIWLKSQTGCDVVFVAGNCDIGSSSPLLKVLNVCGKTVFMAHGHKLGVKYGCDSFIAEARALGADIALFGHTHVPCYSFDGRLHVMNPGSISQPRQGSRESYGIIEIDETGDINCRLVSAQK